MTEVNATSNRNTEWAVHTKLAVSCKVKIIFRQQQRLKSDAINEVSEAIGLLHAPNATLVTDDLSDGGVIEYCGVMSWQFIEKNSNWPNPNNVQETILHDNIEAMIFYNASDNAILRINNVQR